MSENSIEFSLSNSEQRDSWLNSGHQTLDADNWQGVGTWDGSPCCCCCCWDILCGGSNGDGELDGVIDLYSDDS